MVVQDKELVAIIVNGRERKVSRKDLSEGEEISFEQVVALAYDPVPEGPYIEFTVSYRNGAGRPTDGRLRAGQGVKIHDGTVFNVTFTDRS